MAMYTWPSHLPDGEEMISRLDEALRRVRLVVGEIDNGVTFVPPGSTAEVGLFGIGERVAGIESCLGWIEEASNDDRWSEYLAKHPELVGDHAKRAD